MMMNLDFVTCHSKLFIQFILILVGGTGRAEAQECRNYTIMRMHDDIAEIMRVLQLKIYDEEEAEDPTTEMRKAQGIMKGKMDMARDWLNNPSADAHGLGKNLDINY